MDLPLHEDDLAEPGVLEAHMLHRHGADISPVAVLCFFNELLEELAAEGVLETKYVLRSEIGRNPVYEFLTDEGPVSVVHPGVGAPLAAGFVEEIASLGVTTLVACGSAGALVDDLDLGHVMVVASALRDEGTSFHYAAPSRIIDADPLGVRVSVRCWSSTTSNTSSDVRGRPTRSFVRRAHASIDESTSTAPSSTWSPRRSSPSRSIADCVSPNSSTPATLWRVKQWDSRSWSSARSVREELFRVSALAARRLHIATAQ